MRWGGGRDIYFSALACRAALPLLPFALALHPSLTRQYTRLEYWSTGVLEYIGMCVSHHICESTLSTLLRTRVVRLYPHKPFAKNRNCTTRTDTRLRTATMTAAFPVHTNGLWQPSPRRHEQGSSSLQCDGTGIIPQYLIPVLPLSKYSPRTPLELRNQGFPCFPQKQPPCITSTPVTPRSLLFPPVGHISDLDPCPGHFGRWLVVM